MAGGGICCHALTMAAGCCAAGVPHQHPVRRCRRPLRQRVRCGSSSSSSSSGSEVAATAPLWQGNTIVAAPYPQGMIPCNLHRHADAICILAKVQPKVFKQLVASAEKDLINTLLECASNIFNGNMILQPPQKHHLSSHADALMADSESARPEGPNDGRQLCGPAGRQCGFPVPEGPPLNRG